MTVHQALMALGDWSISLSDAMPRDVLDKLDYFGHIAVLSGRVDPRQYGDPLLTAARYVGVLRVRDIEDTGSKLSGVSTAVWLGDQDDKGAVIETAVNLTGATFANSIRALLPAAVTEGTFYAVAGTYTQRVQWQTPKAAINTVCSGFGDGSIGPGGAEWRVNGDATLDAGLVSQLYQSTPTCIIVPKGGDGYDLAMRGLAGTFGVQRDVEDWTSRVVLMGQGSGISLVTGSADIGTNPYKDLHGNPVRMTRLVSESDTPASSANSRAQAQLAQYSGTHDALTLSTGDYEIVDLTGRTGSFAVGDMIWVWDPDAGLIDTNNEITFRGQRINPIALRVTEATWPISQGMTVAYRAADGTWTDLTDYITWETGTTSVVVGGFTQALTAGGSTYQPVGSRPSVDTSIPAAPTLVTPFATSAYLDNRGFTRAKMIVTWSAPLNTDGSTILDGDHYEVRYAVDTNVIYPATWSQVSQIRWEDMQTWAQPFASPTGQWHTSYVPWGTVTVLLQDLSPGVGYDIQVRAVDTSGNAGAWSGTVTVVAQSDNIPPSTPAAPSVAASRIAVQLTHTLGKASGGTYNLESDLDHFDVHASTEPTFTPDATTRIGKLKATGGMIAASLPAVGTFGVESTAAVWVKVVAVDMSGNASNASTAASSTALLIDDQHISDLTVSKLTAGVIGADFIVGARIKTADTGARVELSSLGLLAFDEAGNQTVTVSAGDGSVSVIGKLQTGLSGKRVEVRADGSTPEIRFYNTGSGSDYGSISAYGSVSYSSMHLRGSQGAATAVLTLDGNNHVLRFNDFVGGSVTTSRGDLQLLCEDDSNSIITWWAIDSTPGLGLMTYIAGKMENFNDRGADQGWFPGALNFTGSPGSCSISYGTTRSSHMVPMVTVEDNPATPYAWSIPTENTSGFTVTFAAAANGGVFINFWCFRVA